MSNIEGSPVVAHDDNGQPITEQDLLTESYQKPLQGSTASLLPPFDFDGTEDCCSPEKAGRRLIVTGRT